jgi:hypothetical protein
VRRNKRILVAAVATGALVLAGSAAFTNTIVDSRAANTVAGAYGSLNVSNATVTAISYTLDGNNPPSVTVVHFTTTGDTSGSTAQVGFNGTGVMNVTGCTGTHSGGSPGSTAYDCTLGSAVLVSTITSTDIVVAAGA